MFVVGYWHDNEQELATAQRSGDSAQLFCLGIRL